MILTQCAVCATDLGLSLGKKCGRCSTRYCGPECQVQHLEEGGHDKLCRRIKKAAVPSSTTQTTSTRMPSTVAAEACADDTKGRRATSAHRPSIENEGGPRADVRAAGRQGFAHVSCLAEQAKILVAEAEENNLGIKAYS